MAKRRHALINKPSAASSEVNDLTAAVTWTNIPIANVPTGTSGTTVALGDHLHTGVYEPADAAIVKSDELETITQDWTFTGDVRWDGYGDVYSDFSYHSADENSWMLMKLGNDGVMDFFDIIGVTGFWFEAPVLIKEQTAAGTDKAGSGQIWVKNDTPNTLWFTDDAGTDVQLGTSGAEVNDLSAAVTWANIPDANVPQSAVTQHEGAIDHDALANYAASEHFDEQTKNSSTINNKTANYTLALTDEGETIRFTSGTSTLTIDANATVAMPVGTLIGVVNDSGNSLSIAITTDTLEWTKDNTSGTRTLADGGGAVLQKVDTTLWKISGSALLT